MSLGERSGKSATCTLFMAIGETRIQFGVMQGTASRGRWLADSRLEAAIDAHAGLAASISGAAQPILGLQARLGISGFTSLRVIVADCWLSAMGVPWNPAMERKAGADAFARGQFAAAGHVVDAGDAVRLDDAPFGMPRLTVAYPAVWLGALDQLADDCQTRLDSVLPWSVAFWIFAQSAERRQLQVTALLSEGMLLMLRAAAAGQPWLGEVTVRRGAAGRSLDGSDLNVAWQRLCLRDPHLAPVQRVPFSVLGDEEGKIDAASPFVRLDLPEIGGTALSPALTLAAVAASVPSPLDARTSREGSGTRLQWGGALAAVALIGSLALPMIENARLASALTGQLDAVAKPAPAKPRAVSWSREELAKVQAVNAAIRELNLPVGALLQALEPPADIHVGVLAVETVGGVSDARRPGLRIQAEAHTSEGMTRYAGFLATRKPFTEVYLTRHEVVADALEGPYRFTIEALWDN